MIIGALSIWLYLPNSGSLKDRRQVVKSLTARIANQFGVAAADVGDQDKWQTAELGIACVSNSEKHAARVLESIVAYVERTRPDVEIRDHYTEMFST